MGADARNDPPLRQVEVHEATGVAVVALRGEHDISTAPALERLLEGLADSPVRVVVDLTNADFIDSTVVRVLLTRSKAAPGRFSAITAAGTPSARVFEILSLADVFPTYSSVRDAVDRLRLVGC